MERSSGILLHITSLPSPYGIGDLGPCAHAMADFLDSAGQKRWQVLPVNPTDGINGHSPYSCFSAFAGNPLLISPRQMVLDGFLAQSDLRNVPAFEKTSVDYARVVAFKDKVFDTAFERWKKNGAREDYDNFCFTSRQWLDDYAAFVVAKRVFHGKCWNEWPLDLRRRRPRALAQFAKAHAAAIQRQKFIQYLFQGQWHKFKIYANSRGISIIGDISIYVNYDSADAWCYPQFFKLDARGCMKFVSGCPPDYFSKTGQRWGNPVYDWANLKKENYSWWQRRIGHNLYLFDYLRIDHFRGFLSYWQIPAHERFAVFGRWVKGPGDTFFKSLLAKFGELPLIAEDLGEITPDVPALMRRFKFSGMRVLLFAFGGHLKTNPHVPANYPAHCVVYTGTHDNNTIQGWYHTEANPGEKANLTKVLGRFTPRDLHWTMIRALMKSKADTVILSLADVLGLREGARMNTPATKSDNWKWRVDEKMLKPAVARKLLQLTRGSRRA